MKRISGSAMASSPKTEPVVRSRGVSWLPAMTTTGMRAHSNAAHLAHEVRQRRPGWPRVVEDVAGVQHEIDVSGEDVGDRGREAVLDVDRALVAPRFRIGFAVGGVAKVRIREVSEAKRSLVTPETAVLRSVSALLRQGSERGLRRTIAVHAVELTARSPSRRPVEPIDGGTHLVLARRAFAHQVLQRLEETVAVVADGRCPLLGVEDALRRPCRRPSV